MSIKLNTEKKGFHKKRHGIFYTPLEVAQVMSNWAINFRDDNILEPGFGGCHFLEGSQARLRSLGSSTPQKNLYGCDVDPKAFAHLKKLLGNSNNRRFFQKNFLELTPQAFKVKDGFDVVIGNPPYVSHHNLTYKQYHIAREAIETSNNVLQGKPSLWAYFIIHAVSFLKQGGRMAWILPSSFLYADYAEQVKNEIRENFSRSLFIHLQERLFTDDGTEEVSIIVLCENKRQKQQGSLEITSASDISELKTIINTWKTGAFSGVVYKENANLALLHEDTSTVYSALASQADTLEDFCDVQIGIVSGANKFFILSENQAIEANLPEEVLTFVLTKFRHIEGLKLSIKNLDKIRRSGTPCLLVDTTKTKVVDGTLKEYLNTFPDEKRRSNTTFNRRKKNGVWHQFNDNRIPDAFFPYMLKDGPFIVLNEAGVNSTNSTHRIYFEDTVDEVQKKIIILSILSSFSQLSAEIEGRSYGAGVLKHEPSETKRIKLFVPTNIKGKKIISIFEEAHKLMLAGRREETQVLADSFLKQEYPGLITDKHIEKLSKALQTTRNRRLPNGD